MRWLSELYRRVKFRLGHHIQDFIEYPEVTTLRRRLRQQAAEHADQLVREARQRCLKSTPR